VIHIAIASQQHCSVNLESDYGNFKNARIQVVSLFVRPELAQMIRCGLRDSDLRD
jgi:hypothetical protein